MSQFGLAIDRRKCAIHGVRTVCDFDAANALDVKVQPDPEPSRNVFTRSDQYNFIRAGVPSVMLEFGFLPGSKEEALEKAWLQNRYHAPSDDLQQPVDLEAAARHNRVMLALAEAVANAPVRPQWKPDSFFRRYAQAAGE